jgi:hypothetical protein
MSEAYRRSVPLTSAGADRRAKKFGAIGCLYLEVVVTRKRATTDSSITIKFLLAREQSTSESKGRQTQGGLT